MAETMCHQNIIFRLKPKIETIKLSALKSSLKSGLNAIKRFL